MKIVNTVSGRLSFDDGRPLNAYLLLAGGATYNLEKPYSRARRIKRMAKWTTALTTVAWVVVLFAIYALHRVP